MHDALHEKPVGEVGSGTHTSEQHSSASEHEWPVVKHAPPKFGLQRETPVTLLWQPDLPPLQQFWLAPRPPHTSPSGTQLPTLWHRRTPPASAGPHEPEQQSLSLVQVSWKALHPPMAKQ